MRGCRASCGWRHNTPFKAQSRPGLPPQHKQQRYRTLPFPARAVQCATMHAQSRCPFRRVQAHPGRTKQPQKRLYKQAGPCHWTCRCTQDRVRTERCAAPAPNPDRKPRFRPAQAQGKGLTAFAVGGTKRMVQRQDDHECVCRRRRRACGFPALARSTHRAPPRQSARCLPSASPVRGAHPGGHGHDRGRHRGGAHSAAAGAAGGGSAGGSGGGGGGRLTEPHKVLQHEEHIKEQADAGDAQFGGVAEDERGVVARRCVDALLQQ